MEVAAAGGHEVVAVGELAGEDPPRVVVVAVVDLDADEPGVDELGDVVGVEGTLALRREGVGTTGTPPAARTRRTASVVSTA